jgi:hypothetical protein
LFHIPLWEAYKKSTRRSAVTVVLSEFLSAYTCFHCLAVHFEAAPAGLTKWLGQIVTHIKSWFHRANQINGETDHIDKSTSTLMFLSAWVLGSACAFHYFLQFQSPGHVQGDNMCSAAYVASLPLYKPIQIPMLQCAIKLLSVKFIKQKGKNFRSAFSLCGVISKERICTAHLAPIIWGITFWYLVPLALVVPLLAIFAPAAVVLLAFTLAPCAALYAITAVDGSFVRLFRISRLGQHANISVPQKKCLMECTQARFQADPMTCVKLMTGQEANVVRRFQRKVAIIPTDDVPEQRGTLGVRTAQDILEGAEKWKEVFNANKVEVLLEAVKLQIFKFLFFGGFALVAYINLAFIQFYKNCNWMETLSQASKAVRWPNFSLIFAVSFKLPKLLMFEFDINVRIFLYLGLGLIALDELIKRFRIVFHSWDFASYQRVYDFESLPVNEQEHDLCRRLQGLEGSELCMKMIVIAKQAGGAFGRDVMLAMLRPKLQPHLARFKLSWDDVLPLISDIHSLEDLHHVMKSAPAFVLKLVVKSKLRNLKVGDKNVKRITNIIDTFERDKERVAQLMVAALPLIQGDVDLNKVEVLIIAILRLEKGAESTSDEELKEQAMVVIAEAAKPLVQAKLSALGVPEATQSRLAALMLQAVAEPDQAKAVFAAALPLVQAKPTVAAVEALLLAVLRLDPDNKGLGDGELRAQAIEVIAEAAEPLVQAKLSVLGVPEGGETTQTSVFGAAPALSLASAPVAVATVFAPQEVPSDEDAALVKVQEEEDAAAALVKAQEEKDAAAALVKVQEEKDAAAALLQMV